MVLLQGCPALIEATLTTQVSPLPQCAMICIIDVVIVIIPYLQISCLTALTVTVHSHCIHFHIPLTAFQDSKLEHATRAQPNVRKRPWIFDP
jgi:hypothetical protein